MKKKTGSKKLGYIFTAVALAAVVAAVVVIVFCLRAMGFGGVVTGMGRQDTEDGADAYESDEYESDEYETEDFDGIVLDGEKYVYNDHLSNFLFIGVDKEEQVDTSDGSRHAGQADAIYLMSWDRVTGDVTVIGIPRDTMTDIEIYAYDGTDMGAATDHISLSYGYGDGKHTSCRLTVEAVSNLLYGIPIQGYCSISIGGMPLLTEAVGGVTVTIPNDSLEYLGDEYSEGSEITLDKDNTEIFLRLRDTTTTDSALYRMERQKTFLTAFAEKAESVFSAEPEKLTQLITDLDPYMVTNIGNDQYVKILDGLNDGGQTSYWTVPGEAAEGTYYDEYYVSDEALYGKVIETFYVKQ
ncbi:MAG: LCP family protein [Clostridiales bacterium]|nr:LCP family protein [Clostridiales bacterium]